ncbi:hypothetical protein ACXVUM_17875 [Williamsia sp. SKLECPSW1]
MNPNELDDARRIERAGDRLAHAVAAVCTSPEAIGAVITGALDEHGIDGPAVVGVAFRTLARGPLRMAVEMCDRLAPDNVMRGVWSDTAAGIADGDDPR